MAPGESITVVSVKSGPAGLVVVELRLTDGTRRRLIMGKHTLGVSEVEWSAQALEMLSQMGELQR